jgi:hypothetical protein
MLTFVDCKKAALRLFSKRNALIEIQLELVRLYFIKDINRIN